MTRKNRFGLTGALLLAGSLSGGCVDAVTTGAADGLNSAISAAVEAIVTHALAPITNTE